MLGGAGDNGALDDDRVITRLRAEGVADVDGGLPDVGQIDLVTLERSAHRNQRKLGRVDRRGQIGRRSQPHSEVTPQQLGQPAFVNRRLGPVDLVNLARIDIHAYHVVPFLRQAHAGHQTHVARPDHRHLHRASSSGC